MKKVHTNLHKGKEMKMENMGKTSKNAAFHF